MKTIFVTGAAGMIGKAVVEMLLQKGYNVIGTDTAPAPFEDNQNFSFVQCSITDKEKITGVLNGSKIDMLIHLACTVDNDFPDVLSSDEEKTSAAVDKYLYKAAEAAGVADILMLSTHQIYAPQRTREPIREAAAERPSSIYAKLKADSEKALVTSRLRYTTPRTAVHSFTADTAITDTPSPVFTIW